MHPLQGSDAGRPRHTPGSPEQLLASVSAGLSDGAQRLHKASQHLHSHVLSHNPLQIPSKLQFPSQPISQRTREASSRRSEVLVEEEGVTVAVQVQLSLTFTCLIAFVQSQYFVNMRYQCI